MSSSSSFKYHHREDEEDADDPTARAYANITEVLKQWTSPTDTRRPNLRDDNDDDEEDDDLVMIHQYRASTGSSRASRPVYNEDDDDEMKESDGLVDWLKREIQTTTTTTTPNTSLTAMELDGDDDRKMPARFMLEEPERASTPVTSNSSNKKKKHRSTGSTSSDMSGDPYFAAATPAPKTPLGVISPWNTTMDARMHSSSAGAAAAASSSTMPATPMVGSPPPPEYYSRAIIPSLEHPSHEYRRYHDAVLALRSARQSLNKRLELMQQEVATIQQAPSEDGAMSDTSNPNNNNNALMNLPPSYASYVEDLAQEERGVELNFLQTLAMTCWDRSASVPQSQSKQQQQQQAPPLDLQSQKEATLWMLLYHLRCGGLTTLIWPDDASSQRQTYQAMQHYLTQLAMTASTTATPLELVEALGQTSDEGGDLPRDGDTVLSPPLVLQRRKHILDWLHHFFDRKMVLSSKQQQTSSESSKRSQTTSVWSLPDAPSLVAESEISNDRGRNRRMHQPDDDTIESDRQLFTTCLEYVLAGRLEEAQALCRRQSGQAWRAAQWGGGAPWGKSSSGNSNTTEGNPARAAWKRQMWNLSQECHKVLASATSNRAPAKITTCSWEEAAMYAILSQDVKHSLSNRALRTWEHGLYVSFAGMWGRMEDEVLHRHYDQRRKRYEEQLPAATSNVRMQARVANRRRHPAFPGMSHEFAEVEQLQATGELASMTEATVLQKLSVSAWEEMRGLDPLSTAMSAFLLGKSSIVQYMQQECEQLQEVEDVTHLRVLTHLALYLDSLEASMTTPIVLDDMNQIKHVLLFAYVQHLAQHPELWHMLVLYASFLPEDLILDILPEVLAQVQHDEERQGILEQLQGLLVPGLDLVVLRRLVRLILTTSDGAPKPISAGAATTMMTSTSMVNTPSRSDLFKMKAIGWLYHQDEHLPDALVYSNMLLRHFLSHLRMKSAQWFLQEYSPPVMLDEETSIVQQQNSLVLLEEDDEFSKLTPREQFWKRREDNARSEYTAYQLYIAAFSAFEEWKTALKNTSPLAGSLVEEEVVDETFVEGGSVERAAISFMDRRSLLKSKRKASEAVVGNAEVARAKLMAVLLHPGGWLLEDDEDAKRNQEEADEVLMDEEERRREELTQLRAHHLPLIVSMLHQVCDETAMWLATLLDGCVPRLAVSPRDALVTLDDDFATSTGENAAVANTATSPLSPKYWSQHAMEISNVVASDGNRLFRAFGTADLKEFLAKVTETAVNHLLYTV